MSEKKKIVLFDFDGVIVNTFDISFQIYRRFFPQITVDEYRAFFTGNIYDTTDDYEKQAGGAFDEAEFYRQYVPVFLNCPLVSGIAESIEQLARSYSGIIVSSTISSPIRAYLEKQGLQLYFTEIYGGDVHRSKIEKIKMIFEKYGVESLNCVFITDTLGDLREAEKIGVGTIGVSWGFHQRDMLAKGNPFRIVDLPRDLPSAIGEYFAKA